MFMEAMNAVQDANSFVQSMRKKNQLIMGIGHKIRTIENPDMHHS
jgi:citrate synthase